MEQQAANCALARLVIMVHREAFDVSAKWARVPMLMKRIHR